MSRAWVSIVVGGLAGLGFAALAFVPYLGVLRGCVGCSALLMAGVAATWHYARFRDPSVPGGRGAGLGALAGLVAVLIGLAGLGVLQAIGVLPDVETFAQRVAEGFTDGAELGEEETAWIRERRTRPVFYLGLIGVLALPGLLLGTVGGVIGASVFGAQADASVLRPPQPTPKPGEDGP